MKSKQLQTTDSFSIAHIVFFLTAWIASSIVLIILLNAGGDIIGYDYSYFLPRLFSAQMFHRIEGWGIPRYTAAVCGGIPLYADPQSVWLSIPQILSLQMDCWRAIEISGLLLLLLGGIGQLLLSRNVFKLSTGTSMFSAILFMTNGFFWSRFISGAVSYFPFMLLPGIYFILLYPRTKWFTPALILSLILAWIVYSGGYFIILIFGFTLLPMFALYFWLIPLNDQISFRVIVYRLLLATVFACALCASKFVAIASFLIHFPREFPFDQSESLIKAVVLVFTQLFLFGNYRPYHWHHWEYNNSISPIALFGFWQILKKNYWSRLNKKQGIALLLFILNVIAIWYLASGVGPIKFLKSLPLFNALRVNMRFTATLILPLILLSSFGIKYFNNYFKSFFIISFLAGITNLLPWINNWDEYPQIPAAGVKEFLYLNSLPSSPPFAMHAVVFPPDTSPPIPVESQKAAICFASNDVCESQLGTKVDQYTFLSAGSEFWDLQLFIQGKSNIACHISYFVNKDIRLYPTALPPGEITENGETFNVANPACYTYPTENNCQVGDRIAVKDKENLQALLNFRNTNWKQSSLQDQADAFSFLSLIIILLILTFYFIRFFYDLKE